MTPNSTKVYLVDKDTGEAKHLGNAKHVVAHSGKSNEHPRLGPISITMRHTPEQAKEMQWMLDRPKRIRKYLKELFNFGKKINQ